MTASMKCFSGMDTEKVYPTFDEKHNLVKHMLAVYSILWQGIEMTSKKIPRTDATKTRCHDMLHIAELLPKDATRQNTAYLLSISL